MEKQLQQVRDFHHRMGYAIGQDILDRNPEAERQLHNLEAVLSQWSHHLKHSGDIHLNRMGLILEELSELAEAMAAGDIVAALDGLADLEYVIKGTAVAFNLPLAEAFEEVHRSNMTKDPVENKGSDYQPPRLKEILDAHHRRPRPCRQNNTGPQTDSKIE